MLPCRIPRRVQRDLILLTVLVFLIIFTYKWYLEPSWEEQRELGLSYGPSKNDIFGSNMRPTFADMVHMETLDSSLLPTSYGSTRRLIFIGDVHGCKDELVKLLQKLDFRSPTDHLILTGDMVNKGPDTPGTIELLRSLGASCVRGNNEDRLLLAHSSTATHHRHAADAHLAHESPHGDAADRTLAASLTKAQLHWLAQCPVILHVGTLPGLHDIAVAHAGLVPGVPLRRQDPFAAMNMRAIDPRTRAPSPDRADGLPWWKVWNYHQKIGAGPRPRQTVVYGHDARTGVVIKEYSKGLDSGCVYGGRLTALVVEGRRSRWTLWGRAEVDPARATLRTKLVSVKCAVHKKKG